MQPLGTVKLMTSPATSLSTDQNHTSNYTQYEYIIYIHVYVYVCVCVYRTRRCDKGGLE